MCAQAIVITIQSSETINIEKLIPMCTSLSNFELSYFNHFSFSPPQK
jgi:hypothetical protein